MSATETGVDPGVDGTPPARRGLPFLGAPGSPPRRAAVTTIDQCFASASNFAVVVVVAHVAGPAGLGAYAVAYSVWLVLGAAHRALITDPMSIENDARHADAPVRLQAGFAAEVTLGVAVAVVLALVSLPLLSGGSHHVGIALLTLAPFVPFLLLQDYWRWVGFMQARPGRSLANDAVFNAVQAALLTIFIVGGLRSVSMAIAAWGIGAIAGAAFGLRQFSVHPKARGGAEMLAGRWPMSKWLLASGAAGWGGNQAYPLLAGPAVGASGLGGLKAAQSLISGPCLVLIQAGGSIGLPEASHAYERGGWVPMARVTRWVTIAGIVSVGSVAVVVFVWGSQLLNRIYGHDFVPYADTANIIALSWLIQAFGLGAILTLKATRQARRLFHVSLLSFVVSAISLVAFSYAWGVNGAAWAMVVGSTVTLIALLWAQRLAERECVAMNGVIR